MFKPVVCALGLTAPEVLGDDEEQVRGKLVKLGEVQFGVDGLADGAAQLAHRGLGPVVPCDDGAHGYTHSKVSHSPGVKRSQQRYVRSVGGWPLGGLCLLNQVS